MANLWLSLSPATDPAPWVRLLDEWGHRTQTLSWDEMIRSANPADGVLVDQLPPRLPTELPPLLWIGGDAPPSGFPAIFDSLSLATDADQTQIQLDRAIRLGRAERENENLRRLLDQTKGPQLVGASPVLQTIFDRLDRLSHAKAPVLLTGERGTGKRTLAHELHHRGPRSRRPLVEMSGTVPSPLLESQLFGHAKDAFPGAKREKTGILEQCQGGTLYLDSIGHTSPGFQERLKRLLVDGKFQPVGSETWKASDIRVVVADAGDLKKAVRENRFREDLFFALNVISLHLPPLADRPEDIPILVEAFLRRSAGGLGKRLLGITEEAKKILLERDWEGNATELHRWIEQAASRSEGPWIEPQHLGPLTDPLFATLTKRYPTLEEMEKRYIQLVLEQTGGKKDEAATILGINRRTLYRKEREYGW